MAIFFSFFVQTDMFYVNGLIFNIDGIELKNKTGWIFLQKKIIEKKTKLDGLTHDNNYCTTQKSVQTKTQSVFVQLQ